MSTFSAGKAPYNKNDVKNASLVMKSRQQVINEVNKRRTLLQDNSWIKKRPEEENPNENYGRVVLNQYKSQDSLHRNLRGKDDEKTLLNRYRSDTTLDRIPGRSDADKGENLSALESTRNKSKEQIISGNASDAASPVKKKRQSWMPPSVSSEKVKTDDMEQNKRHSWTPSNTAATVTINNKLNQDMKAAGAKSDQRSLDDLIKVNQPSKSQGNNGDLESIITVKNKSEDGDLDKYIAIKMKSVEGHQDLDDLIKVNCSSDQHGQGHQDLDDLIKINRTSNQHGQGHQDLDDLIKINRTSNQHGQGHQDLDDLIKVNRTSNQHGQGHQDLDDLIKINRTSNQHGQGHQDLDDLIKINRTSNQHGQGHQDLDDLIKVNRTSNQHGQGHQDLDDLIKINRTSNQHGQGHQDLDDLIKINRTSNQHGQGPQDLNDLVTVNRTLEQHKIRLQDLDDIFRVNPTFSQYRTDRQHKMEDLIKVNYTSNHEDKDRELDSFIKVKHQQHQDLDALTKGNLVSNQYGKGEMGLIFVSDLPEGSQLFHVAYEDCIPRRSIKTIYSTSDKSIIEKELCTYCRKPLGTDTKMILEALQICCHATCFKCEVCKAPLENLKAGDSIWLYKNTVHCAPCYSKVKATWIY